MQGIFLNTGNTTMDKQAKFSTPQGAHLPVELETVCKGVKQIVWHVVTAIAYLGCYNKMPHSGWLIRFADHSCGGWKVQDQGTSMVDLWAGLTCDPLPGCQPAPSCWVLT